MQEGFRPFYVDVNDFAGPSGRYLVISILTGSSPTMPEILATMLAVHMESKVIQRIPVGIGKFVGFRGDCIMCDQRPPEDI